MADQNQDRKRQKKSRYVSGNKKRRIENNLVAGMRGVLITCNEKKERYSVREAYNLLNEYADSMYGKEGTTASDTNSSSEDEDIEKAIDKEKKQMKCEFQRFQSMKCGAKNVLFIKTALPNDKDPTGLVHTILSDMLEKNGLNKSRDCMRFLPVSASCYANMKEIESTAENLFRDSLLAHDTKPYKFCVVYKARNNDSVRRDDVIAALAQIVLNSGNDHSVDLSHPELTICVEIVRKICCLSVVKDFHKLKKYNIQEIQKHCQNETTKPQEETQKKDIKCNLNVDQSRLDDIPNEEVEPEDEKRREEEQSSTGTSEDIGLKDEAIDDTGNQDQAAKT